MKKTLFILFLLMCLLPACVSIQLPQFKMIKNTLLNEVDSDPLFQFKWSLVFDSYRKDVYLMSIQSQTLFVNDEQDIAILDEYLLNQIHLPNFSKDRLRIKDSNNGVRQIFVNDTLYETQKCDSWRPTNINSMLDDELAQVYSYLLSSLDNTSILQQVCQGAIQNIHTVILKNGNIELITQYLPYFNKQITISKLVAR